MINFLRARMFCRIFLQVTTCFYIVHVRGYMPQKSRTYLLVCLALAASGGAVSSVQADTYANVARIRVFKEAKIVLYPGEYCYGSANPSAIQASDGTPSLFSRNIKIGMPLTPDTPADYNEYLIEAGKPFTVTAQLEAERNGVTASCGPIGATFFPQPSRDYDVTLAYTGTCYVQIRELSEISRGTVISRVVPSSPSFACSYR